MAKSTSIKVGQLCPICNEAKITRGDLAEAKMNDWNGCRFCFEEAGLENEHQDGYHDADNDVYDENYGPNANCPMCDNYINPRWGHKEEDMTKNETKTCRCGCGQPVKKDYRQGHDARHVSNLVLAAVTGQVTYEAAIKDLDAQARLITKFERAYNNAQDKAAKDRADAKAAKAAAKAKAEAMISYHEVKVGRWWKQIDVIGGDGADGYNVQYVGKDDKIASVNIPADKIETNLR